MNKIFLHLLFTLLLSCLLVKIYAQNKNSEIFDSPFNFNLEMIGNFGEIRSNHFHTGLDFRTQGAVGKKLFAIGDGYVSRIKVSPYGYGKAIYITHPNGLMSVYAHMDAFNDSISKYVLKKQYENEMFELTLYPDSGRFSVKKGEFIGYSGNTGRSSGPHLHFEIRDAFEDCPLNPLLWYPQITDIEKPKIQRIVVYPLSDSSIINNKSSRLIINHKSGESLVTAPLINVYGLIGFGIETYDFIQGRSNKMTPYIIKLFVNDSLIFFSKNDKLPFAESRYVNSLIDYELFLKQDFKIQRSFIEPGNKSGIYVFAVKNGYVNFTKPGEYKINYQVIDYSGNTANISFKVNCNNKMKLPDGNKTENVFMDYKTDNIYKGDSIQLFIYRNCLYNSILFNYRTSFPKTKQYSLIHHVHNEYVPVHDAFLIRIKPFPIPEDIKNKAFIAYLDKDNDMEMIGGIWQNDFLTATARKFGRFFVAIDTIAPDIYPLNIMENADLKNSSEIKFKITDNLTGISDFDGYIDGKWVLFEYDGKNNQISYKFDKQFLKNQKHELYLKAIDGRGNISEVRYNFIR